ncbi:MULTISPECIES: thioredoxin family protein [Aliiglaciecola]|uniref:thioredoxin family protein n=1 Tax=Aliiglaciecola TaxID=1406885 RepID=UPI001C091662|nr:MULTISPECIES: co-chaperone YbbN [Aliiglaciecola]MBU2877643.1 co-chaperone YbbN [Aliiglaciecola lipolytica]MDO6713176.1 co-chaperone YbbN [Aliiglaciecola sp. 2_MG-2023]MDO6754256.1 co-chaperone YbbN [Aliiglaciecola sp. 1_MG-2023]
MQNFVNLNIENFQQVIIEESKEKHVLVNFWAPNLEMCEQLTPILEKLASQHAEHLIYANVNCEQEQQIAQQFGIQSLPTVILVKDGQPVDGFAGPMMEEQIQELLEKHLPNAEDGLYEKAVALVNQGDYQQAFTIAKQAHDLASERADIALVLADCYVELGNTKQAQLLLDNILLVDQNGYYHSIVGKVELVEKASESPEIKQLQAQLEQQPDNLELKVELAVQLHQANKPEEALELLFAVLKKDLSFGDARKYTLDMINAMPDGDPLKSKSRRTMYSLLY